MYIKQILNNNIVVALDDKGRDVIVVAKGIGFQHKSHTDFDRKEYPYLKVYISDNSELGTIRDIYDKIPSKIFELSNKLLEDEKNERSLKNDITITEVMLLADHIHTAVERIQKEHCYLRNALTAEIKMFYQTEFVISMQAKDIVMKEYNVELNDDEISFIATHLINLTSNNMPNTLKTIEIVDELINIVNNNMNITLNPESYCYRRFVTHLKYFATRLINNEKADPVFDEQLDRFVIQNYPEACKCAEAIGEYIKTTWSYEISKDEKIYLILHIENLKKDKKER